MLSFHLNSYTLVWQYNKGQEALPLENNSHSAIIQWLENISFRRLSKEYKYHFHYELPYKIDAQYVFATNNIQSVEQEFKRRILAQQVFKKLKEIYRLDTEIRVWPHHFDTGGYAKLNTTSNVFVGFGLAIPDPVCEDHYFYISGYEDGKVIQTNQFKNLSFGIWAHPKFMGGILPVSNINADNILQFFKEAITAY